MPEPKSRTQLEVTVEYLKAEAEKAGVGAMRKLWLPVLPSVLYLDALDVFVRAAFDGQKWQEKPRRFQLNAIIGMVDDRRIRPDAGVHGFCHGGHHMVIGTVSTASPPCCRRSSIPWPPATRGSVEYLLPGFQRKDAVRVQCLKHVGGYLDESDLETDHVDKFFTMIAHTLDERKARFAGTGFEDAVNHDGGYTGDPYCHRQLRQFPRKNRGNL